jgi:salicylate hydroxylase
MQEHTPSFGVTDPPVLYLGDAAHGMIPTLGQGATQAIEDGCFAGDLITRCLSAGSSDPATWISAIANARTERVRFVMEFSRCASDTMLAGADPVAGTLNKVGPEYRSRLAKLYRDIPSAHEAELQDHKQLIVAS